MSDDTSNPQYPTSARHRLSRTKALIDEVDNALSPQKDRKWDKGKAPAPRLSDRKEFADPLATASRAHAEPVPSKSQSKQEANKRAVEPGFKSPLKSRFGKTNKRKAREPPYSSVESTDFSHGRNDGLDNVRPSPHPDKVDNVLGEAQNGTNEKDDQEARINQSQPRRELRLIGSRMALGSTDAASALNTRSKKDFEFHTTTEMDEGKGRHTSGREEERPGITEVNEDQQKVRGREDIPVLDEIAFDRPTEFGDVAEQRNQLSSESLQLASPKLQGALDALKREETDPEDLPYGQEQDDRGSVLSLEDDTFDTISVMSFDTGITSPSVYGSYAPTSKTVLIDLPQEANDASVAAGPLVKVNTISVGQFCRGIRRLLRHWSKGRHDVFDHEGRFKELLSELQYSKPLEIMVLTTVEYSWTDRFKSYVEEFTSQPWDWWPLAPRKDILQKDHERLKWQCVCGETRTADVRKTQAIYIILLRLAMANESTGNDTRNFKANARSAQATTNHQDFTNPKPQPQPSSRRSPYIPSPIPTLVDDQSSQPNGNAASSRFIPLMVSSETLLLNEIESQDLCNEGLINKIRDAYNDAKGIRRWFTTMRFSHCDFFKFEEWSKGRYCERGPGIPPLDDTEYYYCPRPMDREPPISRHEFHDRFYCKVTSEDCHFGIPRQSCGDRDAVDRIPQAKKQVSVSDGKRQQFYGIVTREKKSGLMMMLYIFVCSIPGTIFFFLWVFRWGHDSLQDASILLMLSWTLLGLLYAAQFL